MAAKDIRNQNEDYNPDSIHAVIARIEANQDAHAKSNREALQRIEEKVDTGNTAIFTRLDTHKDEIESLKGFKKYVVGVSAGIGAFFAVISAIIKFINS